MLKHQRVNWHSKRRILFLLVMALFFCYIVVSPAQSLKAEKQKKNLSYSKEYVIGKGNIKGNVDIAYFHEKDSNFDVGANFYGYAVFKNPNRAFDDLRKKYAMGLYLIQKEFKLKAISKQNYDLYKEYGDQVSPDIGTKDAREQAAFVAVFLDIYENSFVKQ